MDIFIFLSTITLEHLWESFVGESHWPITKMFDISYRIYTVFALRICNSNVHPLRSIFMITYSLGKCNNRMWLEKNVVFNKKADPSSLGNIFKLYDCITVRDTERSLQMVPQTLISLKCHGMWLVPAALMSLNILFSTPCYF